MPSSYSTRLRFELQAVGENNNTWGTKANTVFELIEAAIAGYTSVNVAGTDITLTTNNGSSDEARSAMLELHGVIVSDVDIVIPSVTKSYFIRNATSGAFSITLKTAGALGAVVPQGTESLLYCDSASVRRAYNTKSLAFTSIGTSIAYAADASAVRTLVSLGPTGVSAGTYAGVVDVQIDTFGRIVAVSTSPAVPTGTLFDFAGTSAPDGYLLCYGQAISRSTYGALFAVCSTNFGAGDGSTTFNVPDFRGRVAVIKDDLGGTAANRLGNSLSGGVPIAAATSIGGVGGEQSHLLTSDELASHSHNVFTRDGSGGIVGNRPVGSNLGSNGGGENPGSTQVAGGNNSHNNLQPCIVVSKIIKT